MIKNIFFVIVITAVAHCSPVYADTTTVETTTSTVESTTTTAEATSTTTIIDSDSDDDSIFDAVDNCPNKYNPLQLDANGNGIGDVCDPHPGCGGCGQSTCEQPYIDSDRDGVPDVVDDCPNNPLKLSPGICGCGLADTDSDSDGFPDCIDNCPTIPNGYQLDADRDDTGDVCDPTPGCGGCGQIACENIPDPTAGCGGWGQIACEAVPDQLVINYSAHADTGVTISWSTNSSVGSGYVEVKKQGTENYLTVNASVESIDSSYFFFPLFPDPILHRFSAELTSLLPATSYSYRACNGNGQCSSWHQFTTAPADPQESFQFVYLGDSQQGGLAWSLNVKWLLQDNPLIRFALIAGDLVEYGDKLTEINAFLSLENFASIGLLPVMGNHDYGWHGGESYTQTYSLPTNGVTTPEHDYWIKYGSTLFIVLDTTNPADYLQQAAWVEEVVSENPARWKIISFHYPIWSSVPSRDYSQLRNALMPAIERTGIHLVLSGHDHAYLRTYPLIDGTVVPEGNGPVYMIAVSGPKHYTEQIDSDIIARKFTGISTYQTVEVSYDKIRVSAYSWTNELMDSFEVCCPAEN